MNSPTPRTDEASLDQLIGTGPVRPWWRRPWPWLLTTVVVALVVGGWAWKSQATDPAVPRYVTTPLARGTLTVTVTANGTLEPTRSVAVGSELSGTVARVHADVNDTVRKGQLLVELDTAKLRDAVAAARADLTAAQARRRQSAATVADARTTLGRQEKIASLSDGQFPSRAELDTARTTLEKALADEAAAAATVEQVRAALSTAETNLSKAALRSPIDGVVLARNVEPGYAVAASLQAVTLFTLAEDLRHLQLSVNVDEADVAQVRVGQPAQFTVAAQSGRSYPATITRVAFGSRITDNVVTYTTLMRVDNADLSLRPGMTATATIAANERRDAWLVPNSALRYTPAAAAAGGSPSAAGGGIVSRLMPRPPGAGAARSAGTQNRPGGEATLWVIRNGAPQELRVRKGLSDGRQTEISGDALAEGMLVITGQAASSRGR